MTRPRAIFFGTPAFAVPSLAALSEVGDVVTVITQPDRPAGRGMKLRPPPVKELALARGLHVEQPRKVRTQQFAESLRRLDADVAVVVAYGRILPRAVLDAPRRGCVNVHASLLPRWRGAAPINWAVVHGDRQTGVCLMQMDEGMDTGPVLARTTTPIGADETAGELSARLSEMGAALIRDQLPRFLAGDLVAEPQDGASATMAPLVSREDGRLDWSQTAKSVHDRARGMVPWPGAWTTLDGARVKVHRTRVTDASSAGVAAGSVVRADRHGIEVACGTGVIAIDEIQLEGKRRMAAETFLAGHTLPAGTRFGT